ncbi:hypothetical protein [Streptomyces sp. NPDC056244]
MTHEENKHQPVEKAEEKQPGVIEIRVLDKIETIQAKAPAR